MTQRCFFISCDCIIDTPNTDPEKWTATNKRCRLHKAIGQRHLNEVLTHTRGIRRALNNTTEEHKAFRKRLRDERERIRNLR